MHSWQNTAAPSTLVWDTVLETRIICLSVQIVVQSSQCSLFICKVSYETKYGRFAFELRYALAELAECLYALMELLCFPTHTYPDLFWSTAMVSMCSVWGLVMVFQCSVSSHCWTLYKAFGWSVRTMWLHKASSLEAFLPAPIPAVSALLGPVSQCSAPA